MKPWWKGGTETALFCSKAREVKSQKWQYLTFLLRSSKAYEKENSVSVCFKKFGVK